MIILPIFDFLDIFLLLICYILVGQPSQVHVYQCTQLGEKTGRAGAPWPFIKLGDCGITEMWCDNSHDCRVTMGDYSLQVSLSLFETEYKHTRNGKVEKYLLRTTSSVPVSAKIQLEKQNLRLI